MTETKPISPKKRYALRLVELAKQDPQVGALYPDKSLFEKAKESDLTLDRTIDVFLEGYGDRPALGQRSYDIITDAQGASCRSYQSSYTTITYNELRRRTKAVAMTWRQDPHRVEPEDFVMIMGFADIDFTTLDMACAYAKAITVPVQSNTSGADLNEIVDNIKPKAIAATLDDLEVAAQLVIHSAHVKHLIVFNYDHRVDAERALVERVNQNLKDQRQSATLISINELIELGHDKEWSWMPSPPDHGEQCVAIFHSSGSTGKPKGAIMPEKALIDNWIGRPGSLPRITVHLAPMNHLMGRNNVYTCLSYGGTGYFTLEPDLSSLLEDIRIARPIFLSLIHI